MLPKTMARPNHGEETTVYIHRQEENKANVGDDPSSRSVVDTSHLKHPIHNRPGLDYWTCRKPYMKQQRQPREKRIAKVHVFGMLDSS